VLSAVLLDEARELTLSVGRRALEHHVLEEVGDAGGAARLVARADAVPHLERDDGTAVVLLQQHAQAVLEGGREHALARLGAVALSVTLDSGNKTPARILGLDSVLDVALLRVESAAALPAARLGDSSAVRVGDEVVAIGNPIGLEQTMTRGIVSGLNRLLPGISDEPMIQTDAPINPGNSGGPLVDRCGVVVGINTLISEDAQSIGFAVPINAAKS